MQINIKNQDAHRLATQLSALTGESMTQAITVALRERLAQVCGTENTQTQRLMHIGQVCAKRLQGTVAMQPVDQLLYDERGLPK